MIIREHLVTRQAAEPVIDILTKHKFDVWVYGDNDWYVRSRHGPHVDREEWTVKFPQTVMSTYEGLLDRVVKIVGVSDDEHAMARCVTEVQQRFGHLVSAALSQPYYLDVTHPEANKGEVVGALSTLNEGTYGVCFECGGEIAERRLKALPFVDQREFDVFLNVGLGVFVLIKYLVLLADVGPRRESFLELLASARGDGPRASSSVRDSGFGSSLP
jgi:hypothetical protein